MEDKEVRMITLDLALGNILHELVIKMTQEDSVPNYQDYKDAAVEEIKIVCAQNIDLLK